MPHKWVKVVYNTLAGSLHQLDQSSASDPLTACNMSARSQPFLHAYETPSCLPIHFAVTLSMYAMIPTVYRALLKNAVSGTCHRVHTTKKMGQSCIQYINMRYARRYTWSATQLTCSQTASRAKSCSNTHLSGLYVQACSSAKHTYLSRPNAPAGKLMA